MTRFASCYFCGTALDGSVSEQPVVPEDLASGAETGRSVTLCPDCSRKLDAVLDEVRAAVDAGAEPERAGSAGAGASDDSPAGGDDGGSAIDTDASIEASAEEFFEEAETPTTAESSSESERETGDGGGEQPTNGDGQGRGARSEPESEATRSRSEGDGGEERAQPMGEDAADEGTDSRTSISALENSKVMRMLENREFPVERESFQVVAANAYGVSPSDVGKVLDLAIDRGLIAEQNGDLVKR